VCTHSAKHKGHNAIVFDEARELTQAELEKTLKIADDAYSQAINHTKVLVETGSQIEEAYNSLSQEIHSKFQELLDRVVLKRDQLLAELNGFKHTESSEVQKELNLHKVETSNLGKGLQLGKHISKLSSSTEFFAMVGIVLKSIKIPTQTFKHVPKHWKLSGLFPLIQSEVENVSVLFPFIQSEVEKVSVMEEKNAKSKIIQGIVTTVIPANKIKNPRRFAVTTKDDMFVVCDDGLKKITKGGEITFIKKVSPHSAVTVDFEDCLYIADHFSYKIVKVKQGVETIFAGSRNKGFMNGVGDKAQFGDINDLKVDGKGNVFVTEDNCSVRKITPQGEVSTVAGKGSQGSSDGIGSLATFDRPEGLAVDRAGNIFVCDCFNNKIRKVTAEGIVSTFAGSGEKGWKDGIGTQAEFSLPIGIVIDNEGTLYVCDWSNHCIRKITSEGMVSTIAGSGKGFVDGVGVNAMFNNPYQIARDSEGNLYVTDSDNHTIRKIE